MIFSALQTQVSNKIGYGDQSAKIPTYINSAIHLLEQTDDWPHMESKLTGNLTTSSDSISIPTRYKNCKYKMFITDGDKQKPVSKTDYDFMINMFPLGSSSKGLPKAFASKPSESKFIVRPYPDKTYPYELLVNVFSADLSDNADTNYWTNENWEIVMYRALIEFELDSGAQLKLGTEEVPLSPTLLYTNALAILKGNRIRERKTNSAFLATAGWVV